MGKSLSPPQIHQKINWKLSKFHKTTSERWQRTPGTQKGSPFSSKGERRDPAPPTRTPMQASLTRKPWQATHPTPLTGRNLQNKEELQTSSIQKVHPKHSNLNNMETAEKYSAGKGTWEKPIKPNKRGGDREATWERIQNNDCKNDLNSWKQNGVTDK